eukprot:10032683-Alexandrium_andersonii.AAC.1
MAGACLAQPLRGGRGMLRCSPRGSWSSVLCVACLGPTGTLPWSGVAALARARPPRSAGCAAVQPRA